MWKKLKRKELKGKKLMAKTHMRSDSFPRSLTWGSTLKPTSRAWCWDFLCKKTAFSFYEIPCLLPWKVIYWWSWMTENKVEDNLCNQTHHNFKGFNNVYDGAMWDQPIPSSERMIEHGVMGVSWWCQGNLYEAILFRAWCWLALLQSGCEPHDQRN